MSSATSMYVRAVTEIEGHFDDETLEEIKRYFVALQNLYCDAFNAHIDSWNNDLEKKIPNLKVGVDISDEDYFKYICDNARTITDQINAILLSSKAFETAVDECSDMYVRLKNDHTATYKVRIHCE